VLQAHRLNQHTALLDNPFFNAEMATSPNVVLESRIAGSCDERIISG
jgi:hypothetical protein